jgi:hypothetical protein
MGNSYIWVAQIARNMHLLMNLFQPNAYIDPVCGYAHFSFWSGTAEWNNAGPYIIPIEEDRSPGQAEKNQNDFEPTFANPFKQQ